MAVFCLFYSQVHAFDCGSLLAVDINSASEEELVCITHIGPSRAKDLISLRPFSSVLDMKRIGGIGEPGSATLTAIEEQGLAVVGGGVIFKEKEEEETEEKEEETKEEETKVSAPQIETSAHSSPVRLSTFDEIETFKISAGRDRLVSVDSEVSFVAYIESDASIPRNAEFQWVMGDGSVKMGREVKHEYFAPGNYSVVLTVRMGREEAVSRVQVEVIKPEISIKSVEGGVITLFNSARGEINLGGWEVVSGENSFLIPDNTMIGPSGSLPLHERITGIEVSDGEEVTISSPGGGFESVYGEEEDLKKEEITSQVESDIEEKNRLHSEIRLLREEINRLAFSEREPDREGEVEGVTTKEVDLSEEKETNIEVFEKEVFEKEETSSSPSETSEGDIKVIYEKEGERKGIWRRLLGAPAAVFERLPF